MKPTARKEVITKTVTHTTQVPVIVLEMTEQQANKLAMLLGNFGRELFESDESLFEPLLEVLEARYGGSYSKWKLVNRDLNIQVKEAILMRIKDVDLGLMHLRRDAGI